MREHGAQVRGAIKMCVTHERLSIAAVLGVMAEGAAEDHHGEGNDNEQRDEDGEPMNIA